MNYRPLALALALLPAGLKAATTESGTADPVLPEVVVTGARMASPLVVETDLKVPRQPLPAHDGADYLKTIPGFNVIRKGGTDGDPVLRGMAGSRLNVLVDGQTVLGGCNFRMDAPTAYIFPEAYDTLTVVKGPQSVRYGPGTSAGTVRFDREPIPFGEAGFRAEGSVMAGSFSRHDEVFDGRFGNGKAYGRVALTNSQSGDYRDGDGVDVHSAYHRYSLNVAAGLTPDEDTRAEVFGAYSDGWAAYADRGMDGTKFLRENVGARFEKRHLTPWLDKLEIQFSRNDVDHIMDDQTLRSPGMMGYANLKRETTEFRTAATIALSPKARLVVGIDAQLNEHSSRSAMPGMPYGAFADDAEFRQWGLFGELTMTWDDIQRTIAGYRFDDWEAKDKRAAMIMNMNAMGMIANPSAGKTRDDTLSSGFIRHERTFGAITGYAGLGHVERFPDYWELISKQSATTGSAFNTRAEKTNQLDVGMIYASAGTHLSLSGFYSKVDDFILIDYRTKMATGASRNIDATTYGLEFGWDQTLSERWKMTSALSYVRGENETDDRPLAQLPPLEARVGLNYSDKVWSFGALTRLVAAQDRFDAGQGNIVGKDLGRTPGFAVFSINGGWRANKTTLLTAGIDNLFDRAYAEAISRSSGNGMGGAIPGYAQTLRVNEPGRTVWFKANITLD